MTRSEDDSTIVHPEVFTMHWEGPATRIAPEDEASRETNGDADAAHASELRAFESTDRGRALWKQIGEEAARKGDGEVWRRKLHAYWWVKLESTGTAGAYARKNGVNHATVRTWIRDVSRLAYEVGYRLHEDRLLLIGEAPSGLLRLRELVNRDAGSPEALAALHDAAREFRGRDAYFHLNEGHVLRARDELSASDATLREGLTLAEARPLRSLLWNACGQTLWDCGPESSWPVSDHLERAERAFRRAAALDPFTYFPYVNLAQMAVDGRDMRRAEYWVSELASARKRMTDEMKHGLAGYLNEAEWTRPVEERRFWRAGPARWIREAATKGLLALLAIALFLAASPPDSASAGESPRAVDIVENGGGGKNSGAGGN